MIVAANLTEEEIKAFKARKEQELGPGSCVDVYRCQGRLIARAYFGKRGPKPGTKYRSSSEPQQGGTAARTAGGVANH
jgi:hypothetical protein